MTRGDRHEKQPFGLPQRTLDDIAHALKRYPEITRVQIFGSRAMGNWRYNSDIDIAVWGDFDSTITNRIAGELDELPTPYKYDVVHYETISHPPFKAHIDEHGVDFKY